MQTLHPLDSRQPSSPTSGAWHASPSTARSGIDSAGWPHSSMPPPARCGWPSSIRGCRTNATSKACRAPRLQPSWPHSCGARADGTNRVCLDLILAFSITAAAGVLMVSRFSYSSFKGFDLTRPVRFISLVIVVAGFIFIAQDPPLVLLAIFGGYAAWSPIVWLWRRVRRLRRAERPAASTRAHLVNTSRSVSRGARHRPVAHRARR